MELRGIYYYFRSIQVDKFNVTITIWVSPTGVEPSPSPLSSRIVFWFGFIISSLIYTAYSAALASILTVVLPATLPFSNLKELSKLSRWSAGCNNADLFQVTASVRPTTITGFDNKCCY